MAVETFEHLFGEEHPIIQKYFNYSADVYSYSDEYASMLSMAQKNLDIVEKNNQPSSTDSPPSVFILDALLQLISM